MENTKWGLAGDAAKMSNRSVPWIQRLCDEGKLRCIRLPSGMRLIDLGSVEEWIKARDAKRAAQGAK